MWKHCADPGEPGGHFATATWSVNANVEAALTDLVGAALAVAEGEAALGGSPADCPLQLAIPSTQIPATSAEARADLPTSTNSSCSARQTSLAIIQARTSRRQPWAPGGPGLPDRFLASTGLDLSDVTPAIKHVLDE